MVGGSVEKSRGLDTGELQLSPEAVFAMRKDAPSAHGERGNVCEFAWVVSIENEGVAIVQRQLRRIPFGRCVLPSIFRWRICLIAPAPVDRNIQRLHRLDVIRRIGRRRQQDDAFP